VREVLLPEGADVVATFEDGSPAVTHAAFGKGHAILIGSYVALPAYREGERTNGDLLAGLAAWKVPSSRPAVAEGAAVRVDLLRHPSGGAMLIARNLEASPVRAAVTVPGLTARTLTELFTGERLVGAADGNGAMLATLAFAGGEVKVFRG
jgi:hypothetical protein